VTSKGPERGLEAIRDSAVVRPSGMSVSSAHLSIQGYNVTIPGHTRKKYAVRCVPTSWNLLGSRIVLTQRRLNLSSPTYATPRQRVTSQDVDCAVRPCHAVLLARALSPLAPSRFEAASITPWKRRERPLSRGEFGLGMTLWCGQISIEVGVGFTGTTSL
jgi:hypothetical protein